MLGAQDLRQHHAFTLDDSIIGSWVNMPFWIFGSVNAALCGCDMAWINWFAALAADVESAEGVSAAP